MVLIFLHFHPIQYAFFHFLSQAVSFLSTYATLFNCIQTQRGIKEESNYAACNCVMFGLSSFTSTVSLQCQRNYKWAREEALDIQTGKQKFGDIWWFLQLEGETCSGFSYTSSLRSLSRVTI